MSVAIRAEGLSKRYMIGHRHAATYGTLRDSLADAVRAFGRRVAHPFAAGAPNGDAGETQEEFWALRDASFEIEQGERLGIVGRNGAGKSTLLKILSRITEPTRGRVEIHGRVASLLEVGTGFHPELTGRENIFLNGAVLGMSRSEIVRKFDEIVAFAEVEKFLDTPVKRYSSGMYVRLAFAVAAHLEPEVLIVDEVLAVGDMRFQDRCLGKMRAIGATGRTVLFVSHNAGAIRALCTRACWLDDGRVARIGDVQEVVDAYVSAVADTRAEGAVPVASRPEDQRFFVEGMTLFADGVAASAIPCGAPMALEIAYATREPLHHLRMHVVIDTAFGEHVVYLGTDLAGQDFVDPPVAGRIRCDLGACALMPGSYSISVYGVTNGEHGDEFLDALRFQVADRNYFGTGLLPPRNFARVLVRHRWGIEETQLARPR